MPTGSQPRGTRLMAAHSEVNPSMSPRSRKYFRILLFATVVIDAIALRWIGVAPYSDGSFTLYYGLSAAHVALLATWGVVFSRRSRWAVLVPFSAASVIALGGTVAIIQHDLFDFWEGFLLFSTIFALQAALAMATAWILRQYRPDWFGQAREGGARWRFTTSHLLLLMTTTAALVVLTRAARELHQDWPILVAFLANNCLVLVASIALQRMPGNRVLRFAATLACVAFVATAWEFVPVDLGMSWYLLNLIQAIFLWFWLPWGFTIDRYGTRGADSTIPARAG